MLNILYRVGREPERDRAAVAPEGRLLSNHLLAPGPEIQGDEPLPGRFLRVDDRIVDFLLGGNGLDGRLHGIVARIDEPVDLDDLIVDLDVSEPKTPTYPKKPGHLDQLRTLARWWQRCQAEKKGGVLFMHGPYGNGRQVAAQAICTRTGTQLLRADAGAALRLPYGFALIVDLVYREVRLQRSAIFRSD